MDFIRVSTKPPLSRFPDPEATAEFWLSYFRYPRHDLAEQVIALRRLRGLTQAELAEKVGTQQPAIARIEAAQANVGLDSVRSLAVALDAVVRIEMRPAEHCLYSLPLRGPSPRTAWTPVDLGPHVTAYSWHIAPEVKMLPVRTESVDDANLNCALSA